MADKYAILQLKRTDETAQERFMRLEWLESRGMKPEPSHYDLIYVDDLAPGTRLEDLYIKFNRGLLPLDFHGHSMSVSDIVILLRANQPTAYYYCDSQGFKRLPGFQHPEVEALMKPEEDVTNV